MCISLSLIPLQLSLNWEVGGIAGSAIEGSFPSAGPTILEVGEDIWLSIFHQEELCLRLYRVC